MNFFGVDMPQERKIQIMDYLDRNGCQPSQKGYQYLVGLISLLADNPSLNCNELLSEYCDSVLGKKDKNEAWRVYRACRYTLHTSMGSKTYKPYSFIISGVMSLGEVI